MADPVNLDERREALDRAAALAELGDGNERLADWLAGEPRRRRLRPRVAAALLLTVDEWAPWQGLDVEAREAKTTKIADDLDAYRTFRGGVSTAADAARVVTARMEGLPEPLGQRLAAALLRAAQDSTKPTIPTGLQTID